MQRSKLDVWVGLFVLLGAAAILFLALKSANLLSLNFPRFGTVTTPSASHGFVFFAATTAVGSIKQVTDLLRPNFDVANPCLPVIVVNCTDSPRFTSSVCGFAAGLFVGGATSTTIFAIAT